jgi:epoxyqueuosine reductase
MCWSRLFLCFIIHEERFIECIKNMNYFLQMESLSVIFKKLAIRAGFDLVGITNIQPPDKINFLDEWLHRDYHGTMNWMKIRQAMRKDIKLLFPGARSLICVGHNYYLPDQNTENEEHALISKYARGIDYHAVMKKKLKRLLVEMKKYHPGLNGRICVDSAPLLEKVWAEAAGLGWQGKHTNLISPGFGSWFFLGEIITDAELVPDQPVKNHCGTCRACLTACPTGALVQPYVLDASRCISYLTIEYRSAQFPDDLAPKMGRWIFGCDICQQVCPWNKFRKIAGEPAYRSARENIRLTFSRLLTMGETEFRQLFKHSAVKRTGYKNFMRNVQNAYVNSTMAE